MSQLTEGAKKRMEDIHFCEQELLEMSQDHSGEHQYAFDFRIGFRKGFTRGKEAGYQAGMQDQDANKELLDECEKFFDQLNNSAFWVPPAMRGVFNHERISGLLNKIREARK